MSATPDSTFTDPKQRIADLERQLAEREAELAERTAERDEALEQQTATGRCLSVPRAQRTAGIHPERTLSAGTERQILSTKTAPQKQSRKIASGKSLAVLILLYRIKSGLDGNEAAMAWNGWKLADRSCLDHCRRSLRATRISSCQS